MQRRSLHEATARINIWHGAVRSGKTVASEVAWLRRLRSGPPGDALMVGKTERTLLRNVLIPLERMVGSRRMHVTIGSGTARILGRNVWLVGANDERAEQKIRGLTLAAAYGDEVSTWAESFFTMLLSRLSLAGAAFFGTTNPDAPLHWLKARYLDRDDLDLRAWHFRLEDNPFLDTAYVEAIRREYVGLWHARFIEGRWVQAEGAVWDGFDPGRHVVAELPTGLDVADRFAAIDYGTSNPFVGLLVVVDRAGCYWVEDEYRWDSAVEHRQLTDGQYVAALRARWAERAPSVCYVDPSAASFRLELAQSDWTGVADADNAVLDGLRCVASLFACDRLRIVATCTGLIDELQSYSWDARAQARGIDAPRKQHDHGPDALRYALFTHDRRARGVVDSGWM